MSANFTNLVAQGRAKANGVYWTNEEWQTVCDIVQKRNVERVIAADMVRNGIKTIEDYDNAVEAKFVPQSLEEAAKESAKAMEAKSAEIVQPKSKKKIK
jgi:hypothetical protein